MMETGHGEARRICQNMAACLDKKNGIIAMKNILALRNGTYEPEEPEFSHFAPADILLSIKAKIPNLKVFIDKVDRNKNGVISAVELLTFSDRYVETKFFPCDRDIIYPIFKKFSS